MPNEARAGAVLYAKNVDLVAKFYAAVFGLVVVHHDDEYVQLESPAFQLVVLRMHRHAAEQNEISVPPMRRSDVAIKLVFFVASIAAVRQAAEALGGVVNAASKEWLFNGVKVCDGLDPERNVIQVRELAA